MANKPQRTASKARMRTATLATAATTHYGIAMLTREGTGINVAWMPHSIVHLAEWDREPSAKSRVAREELEWAAQFRSALDKSDEIFTAWCASHRVKDPDDDLKLDYPLVEYLDAFLRYVRRHDLAEVTAELGVLADVAFARAVAVAPLLTARSIAFAVESHLKGPDSALSGGARRAAIGWLMAGYKAVPSPPTLDMARGEIKEAVAINNTRTQLTRLVEALQKLAAAASQTGQPPSLAPPPAEVSGSTPTVPTGRVAPKPSDLPPRPRGSVVLRLVGPSDSTRPVVSHPVDWNYGDPQLGRRLSQAAGRWQSDITTHEKHATQTLHGPVARLRDVRDDPSQALTELLDVVGCADSDVLKAVGPVKFARAMAALRWRQPTEADLLAPRLIHAAKALLLALHRAEQPAHQVELVSQLVNCANRASAALRAVVGLADVVPATGDDALRAQLADHCAQASAASDWFRQLAGNAAETVADPVTFADALLAVDAYRQQLPSVAPQLAILLADAAPLRSPQTTVQRSAAPSASIVTPARSEAPTPIALTPTPTLSVENWSDGLVGDRPALLNFPRLTSDGFRYQRLTIGGADQPVVAIETLVAAVEKLQKNLEEDCLGMPAAVGKFIETRVQPILVESVQQLSMALWASQAGDEHAAYREFVGGVTTLQAARTVTQDRFLGDDPELVEGRQRVIAELVEPKNIDRAWARDAAPLLALAWHQQRVVLAAKGPNPDLSPFHRFLRIALEAMTPADRLEHGEAITTLESDVGLGVQAAKVSSRTTMRASTIASAAEKLKKSDPFGAWLNPDPLQVLGIPTLVAEPIAPGTNAFPKPAAPAGVTLNGAAAQQHSGMPR